MNFTPRYLGRGSWLARRDPRLLVLAIVCFVFTAVQVWDVRLMLVLVAIAFLYYRSAGIPFREVRRQWTFAIVFISLIVIVNGLISSGRMRGVESDTVHLYGYLPLLGTPIGRNEARVQDASGAESTHERRQQHAERDRGGADDQLEQLEPDHLVNQSTAAAPHEKQENPWGRSLGRVGHRPRLLYLMPRDPQS